MYGGIVFILVGIGIVNKKVLKCLILLIKDDVDSDNIKEKIFKEDVVDVENVEVID